MLEFVTGAELEQERRVETLDLRSIGLTLSLCGFALTAVLWAASRDGDRIAGIDAWLLSAATMSAGLGLSSLQGWIPDWASRVLGNTMLVAAPVLAWQGSRSFRGVPTGYQTAIAAVLWTLLSGIVFVYLWPSARMRIILASGTMAIACTLAGRDFLLQRRLHLGIASRFGGIPMLLFALMMTIRAVDAMVRPEDALRVVLSPTPVNVATYLLGCVVLLCAIAGMVMNVTATRAEQTRDLAYRDLLTSALSRRGLYAAFPLWARQYTPGAAVVVLDINGFKAVNDALGHEKGDQVLQSLANACSASLPAGALFARFGGDEFVALLPKTTPFEKTLLAMATSFHLQCADLLSGVKTPVPTVAIGYARLDGGSTTDFETALRAADALMYSRKVRDTSPYSLPA